MSVAMNITRLERNRGAVASGNAFKGIHDHYIVMFDNAKPFAQQQRRKTIDATFSDYNNFAFRQQGVCRVIMPDIFSWRPIEDFDTFAFPCAIDQMHDPGGHHDDTLLVGINTCVVEITRRSLYFQE